MDTVSKTLDAASAIEQAGMQDNSQVILFDGTNVNVFSPGAEAFESKRFAVSLFNIQRWNGHLRVPGAFSLSPSRSLDDGVGRNYAFYSDLAHSILVALYVQRSMEDSVTRRRRVRQALMHEASEVIIGDMVGPFKRQIKDRVKPFERRIDAKAFGTIRDTINDGTDSPGLHPIDLMVPEGDEAYNLKQADIVAQDIEAWAGQKTHIRGVNISVDFCETRWMLPGLAYALNVTPDGYVNALRHGDVLAGCRNTPPGRPTEAEFRLYADNAGIGYDPEDIPLWTVWLQVMMRSPDHIRDRMLAKAKGDRQALSSGLIVGDDDE